MVLNATFNNISVISWRSVLLVEETEVPGYPIMLYRVHFAWTEKWERILLFPNELRLCRHWYGLGQAQIWAKVKPVNGNPTPSW